MFVLKRGVCGSFFFIKKEEKEKKEKEKGEGKGEALNK